MKRTAQDYMAEGHNIEADGWIITLDDSDCPECPVAIHATTGEIFPLAYNEDWRNEEPRLDDNMAHYSRDWFSSPLEEHWGNPRLLLADLQAMYDAGLLRAVGAVYGLPGASSLGAIFR